MDTSQLVDIDGDGFARDVVLSPEDSLDFWLGVIPRQSGDGMDDYLGNTRPCDGFVLNPGTYSGPFRLEGRRTRLVAAVPGEVNLDPGDCEGDLCTTLYLDDNASVELYDVDLIAGRGTRLTESQREEVNPAFIHPDMWRSYTSQFPQLRQVQELSEDEIRGGGALWVGKGSMVTMVGGHIQSYLDGAEVGTAAFASGGSLDLQNVEIRGDALDQNRPDVRHHLFTAAHQPQATTALLYESPLYGGAVVASNGSLRLSQVLVEEHNVDTPHLMMGGGVTSLSSELEIVDSLIQMNFAQIGAGLIQGSFFDPEVTISNTTVMGNLADLGAGGLLWVDGTPDDQSAPTRVSGVILASNFAALGQGGGGTLWGAVPEIFSNTLITQNYAPMGGGLVVTSLTKSGEYERETTLSNLVFNQNMSLDLVPADLWLYEGITMETAEPEALFPQYSTPAVEASVFLPLGTPSVGCPVGEDFLVNTFYGVAPFGISGCDLPADGSGSMVLTEPPYPTWELDTNDPDDDVGEWWTVDYHLPEDSALVDGGVPPGEGATGPNLDSDGDPRDIGVYGGPLGAFGMGQLTSTCLREDNSLRSPRLDGTALRWVDSPDRATTWILFRADYAGDNLTAMLSGRSVVGASWYSGASVAARWLISESPLPCEDTSLTPKMAAQGGLLATEYMAEAPGFYLLKVETTGQRGLVTLSSS